LNKYLTKNVKVLFTWFQLKIPTIRTF
jgi:hypothetical protein